MGRDGSKKIGRPRHHLHALAGSLPPPLTCTNPRRLASTTVQSPAPAKLRHTASAAPVLPLPASRRTFSNPRQVRWPNLAPGPARHPTAPVTGLRAAWSAPNVDPCWDSIRCRLCQQDEGRAFSERISAGGAVGGRVARGAKTKPPTSGGFAIDQSQPLGWLFGFGD